MQRSVNIKFNLNTDDAGEVTKEQQTELEEKCLERIFEQYKQGIWQGELCETVNEIDVYGWYEMKINRF
jgi:hypothetical protein